MNDSIEQEEWIRTDDLQFVKKESEDEFVVLETVHISDDNVYILQKVEVNISHLSESKLEDLASGYYNSLQHLKEESGDAWKQYMAEIIAELEQFQESDNRFTSRKELFAHLKESYRIESSPEDWIEEE